MTATVTRIGIPDANSATASATAGATMVEPVPLIAEWVEHGFVQIKDAQDDTLTAIETAVQMCSKAAQASTVCHLRLVEMAYASLPVRAQEACYAER